jgi:hypothetical protein
MCAKIKQEAQNPLILRSLRLMEAFAKSDDERDFYLDKTEGFLIYVDLDKPDEDLAALEEELGTNNDRYCMIPKLTFYETKKIMEGFVNEKVYDIDTKERLLDIIQSKEARENFLEFIFDHHTELEKWQQYYQERSRIRIIEWLRNNHFHFVFEEDLDLPHSIIEKLKQGLFQSKVSKDVEASRKALFVKAKTYYSNEALNPRPKRGRPPKQTVKAEVEHHVTTDIYISVPQKLRPFLFTPDISPLSILSFSSKFEGVESSLAQRRMAQAIATAAELNDDKLDQKMTVLRNLSSRWLTDEAKKPSFDEEEEDEDWDDDFDDDDEVVAPKAKRVSSKAKSITSKDKPAPKKAPAPISKKVAGKTSPATSKKPLVKRIMPIVKKGGGKPMIQEKKQIITKELPKKPAAAKPEAPLKKQKKR